VTAYEDVGKADYGFLAGCESVKHLVLSGAFHDDGFWQFLPEMKSLERVVIEAGSKLHGEGIPNLSQSNFSNMGIKGVTTDCELRNVAELFTAGKLKELIVHHVRFNLTGNVPQIGPTSLTSLRLQLTIGTDQLIPILAQVKTLETVVFWNCRLTGETLDQLAAVPIQQIEFDMVPLTAAGLENLSKFSSLKNLVVRRSVEPNSEWVNSWADSPLSSSLETLVLSPHGAGDELIDDLNTFSDLKSLTITKGDISGPGILKLADHPTLEQLNIGGGFPRELIFDFRKKVNDRGAKIPQIEIEGRAASRRFSPYLTLPTSPGKKSGLRRWEPAGSSPRGPGVPPRP
jgi:hypothetical protein